MPDGSLNRLKTLALLVGLGLSGCFCGQDDLPDPPAECTPDGVGCLPDESCQAGQCVKFEPCESDEDCLSAHYRCTFPAQLCELRPGFDLECQDSTDCEPGNYCALGRCRPTGEARPCITRGDCPQGQACSAIHYFCIQEAPCTLVEEFPEVACDADETCDEASGRCQLPCQNECTVETEEEDCGVGRRCDAACRCVQCLTDADCGQGLICNVRQGRCVSENLCYSDDDCEEPLICDPATALCQVAPPPCEDDLDCPISEICNRATGVCELPGGACLDDRFEDADTPAQAEEVEVPEGGEAVLLDDLQLCPDDDDVYAVALEPGDLLEVSVTETEPGARATVWLLDPEGETSVSFAEAPPYGNGTVTYSAQAEETIFIRVTALLASTPYELTLSRTAGQPCEADVWEGETGNDTPETATEADTFPLNQTLVATLCPEDRDLYAVALEPGEGVEVEVGFDDTVNDLDLDLIDALSGELLARSAGVTSPESIRFRTQLARTVLVDVHAFGSSTGPYTVSVEKLEPFECEADELEGEEPTLVPTGETIDEQARTLCQGDADTYRVPLLDFERVVAQATFEPAELDVKIEVLDETGENVLVSSPNAGGAETVTYSAQGDEEILVRFSSQLNTRGAYTASIFRENQVDCAPDPLEPNDSVGTGVPAPDGVASLSICDNDNDYFVVDGTAGKRLIARAAFLHSDADLDLMILGLDGVQVLAVSDGIGNHEEAEAELPLDGKYYVRVFSLSDGAEARYELEIVLTD